MGPPIEVEIIVEPSAGDIAEDIERNLLASLRANVPSSAYRKLAVVARDSDGALLGGLAGSTSYGWLLIKALWVAHAYRNRRLGTRIMEVAESTALTRGCHGAWLDTSNTRACRFYTSLGYRPFGKLENVAGESPEGHRRVFLCKRLSARLGEPLPSV